MSSPLPVPSKVAVTALRGLIVGTSCSLALITEDRRRRINNAHSAVQNAQRIKSARGYRTGGGDLAVALEEEVLLEPSFVPWTSPQPVENCNRGDNWARRSQQALEREKRLKGGDSITEVPERIYSGDTPVVSYNNDNAKDRTNIAASEPVSDAVSDSFVVVHKPSLRIQPSNFPPANWKRKQEKAKQEAKNAFAFPTPEEILVLAKDCETTRDLRRLESTLLLVYEALAVEKRRQDPNTPLHQAAAALSRTCQRAGRFVDAGKLLRLVIGRGPIGEEDYFAFEPLGLIEGLLPKRDSIPAAETANPDKLRLATELYLPTFGERPKVADLRPFEIGKRLLESWFSLGNLEHIDRLYWRCLVYNQDDYSFTAWFLAQLHEKAAHRKVIKYFSLCYAKMTPSQESIHTVGDIVVESVATAHNFKAGQVLTTLLNLCSNTCKLKTAWAIKLLSSHWQRYHDLDKTEQLFRTLLGSGLKGTVYHPDGLYRIMTEISFQADQPRIAESYFDQAVKEKPELASDVRLLGLVGRHKAKLGDWGGVQRSFEPMDISSKQASKAAGEVFVPVLKIYAQSHTISETELFLRFYVDKLKVPITPYTVTLVAYHYGAVRDIRSLVQWLKYCADSGFKVDAAFSNAILTTCRRRWKFSFRDLRTMFLKLRSLSPDFADKFTERAMVQAALSDPNRGAKSVAGRFLSLDIDVGKLLGGGKCPAPRDVVQTMKQLLTFGRAGQALGVYTRATHQGMPFNSHALHLAVQASLKLHGDDDKHAFSLVRRAQQEGEDVSSAVVPILATQISQISATPARKDRAGALRRVIGQFEEKQIKISDVSLNMAAISCLRAGLYVDAVEFGLAAAKAAGDAGPCYNMYNFSVLVSAYAGLGDCKSLERAIGRGQSSDYWTDKYCLRALKRSRNNARWQNGGRQAGLTRPPQDIISTAIKDAVGDRKNLSRERYLLQEEMLGIMKQAAVNSYTAADNFEDTAFLDEIWPETRDRKISQRVSRFEETGTRVPTSSTSLDKVLEQRSIHVGAVPG